MNRTLAPPRKPRTSTTRQLLLAALLLAAACGNTAAVPAPDDLTMLPALPDLLGVDFKDSDYPPGPYAQSGNVNTGDVLPDLTFQGYWSPTATTGLAKTQPFGEITFGMLHHSGARYAVLNLTAFW